MKDVSIEVFYLCFPLYDTFFTILNCFVDGYILLLLSDLDHFPGSAVTCNRYKI